MYTLGRTRCGEQKKRGVAEKAPETTVTYQRLGTHSGLERLVVRLKVALERAVRDKPPPLLSLSAFAPSPPCLAQSLHSLILSYPIQFCTPSVIGVDSPMYRCSANTSSALKSGASVYMRPVLFTYSSTGDSLPT